MKRKAKAMVLLAALGGGCLSTEKTDPGMHAHNGVSGRMKANPAFVGPWGDPVPAQSVKRVNKGGDVVQAGYEQAGKGGEIQQVNGIGPRHGLAIPNSVPGAVAATGALVAGPQANMGNGRTSIRFAGPDRMKVAWFAGGGFTDTMVEAPGRYNFPQGGVFRLKLSNLPNRPGVELYPTLEVIPASQKTAVFLSHSAVPLGVTEEDLEQVASGNFVTKVIYLPDPAYQDLAATGPDEIVSSRLEPGVDPVAEATRRGSVLAILRLGNIDLEAQNTPAMTAPPGGAIGVPPGGMLPPGAIPFGSPMQRPSAAAPGTQR